MNSKTNIFEKENIFKLCIKVVLPSLIISLLFGIYVFADQVLMQQIIPNNGKNFLYQNFLSHKFTNEDFTKIFTKIYPLFGANNEYLNKDLYTENGKIILENALYQANKDAIFLSVSTIGTINLILISMGFFINTGASIIYSRLLAQKNWLEIKKLFSNSFYNSLIVSLILFVILLSSQNAIFNIIVPNAKNLANEYNDALIMKYFEVRNEAILNFSNNYTYFISSSIPIAMILNLFIFFTRAEGKNGFVTLISLFCNLLNICLDLIFFLSFKMNIMGGGLATFIGYIINISSVSFYIHYLERKSMINFSFKDLKKYNFKLNYLISSFVLSLGTFLRDLSLAVANIIYIPIFTKTLSTLVNNGIMTSLEVNDIFAVSITPIYNLFFFAMYGIIDGMRPIIAYNYQKQQYNRVKIIYYYGMILGIIFSIVVNMIFYFILNENVLNFFNATTNSRKEIFKTLFFCTMFQLPFVAISISGLSLFQSSGKMFMTIFLSLFQGLICFIPILFTMSNIAITIENKYVMIYTGFSNILISSLLIDVFSEIYLHLFMGKKERSNDPLNQVDKIINHMHGHKKMLS